MPPLQERPFPGRPRIPPLLQPRCCAPSQAASTPTNLTPMRSRMGPSHTPQVPAPTSAAAWLDRPRVRRHQVGRVAQAATQHTHSRKRLSTTRRSAQHPYTTPHASLRCRTRTGDRLFRCGVRNVLPELLLQACSHLCKQDTLPAQPSCKNSEAQAQACAQSYACVCFHLALHKHTDACTQVCRLHGCVYAYTHTHTPFLVYITDGQRHNFSSAP